MKLHAKITVYCQQVRRDPKQSAGHPDIAGIVTRMADVISGRSHSDFSSFKPPRPAAVSCPIVTKNQTSHSYNFSHFTYNFFSTAIQLQIDNVGSF